MDFHPHHEIKSLKFAFKHLLGNPREQNQKNYGGSQGDDQREQCDPNPAEIAILRCAGRRARSVRQRSPSVKIHEASILPQGAEDEAAGPALIVMKITADTAPVGENAGEGDVGMRDQIQMRATNPNSSSPSSLP